MAVSSKAKAISKGRSTFSLEIQHEGLNLSTKELEKRLKAHLKAEGFVLSGCDLKSFFVPSHQTLYYTVEREGAQLTSGVLAFA